MGISRRTHKEIKLLCFFYHYCFLYATIVSKGSKEAPLVHLRMWLSVVMCEGREILSPKARLEGRE